MCTTVLQGFLLGSPETQSVGPRQECFLKIIEHDQIVIRMKSINIIGSVDNKVIIYDEQS